GLAVEDRIGVRSRDESGERPVEEIRLARASCAELARADEEVRDAVAIDIARRDRAAELVVLALAGDDRVGGRRADRSRHGTVEHVGGARPAAVEIRTRRADDE